MERRVEYMPLAEIARAPRNPKRHADDVIAASIERFGFVELPTLDERTGRLVAGHGRLDSLTALAASADADAPLPDGVKLGTDGWMIPVVRGWESRDDTEADGYLITANRTTELGGWETRELADMLAELQAGPGLAGIGYEDDDLAVMLAALEVPAFLPTSADEQPRLDQREPITCPQCGHEFPRP